MTDELIAKDKKGFELLYLSSWQSLSVVGAMAWQKQEVATARSPRSVFPRHHYLLQATAALCIRLYTCQYCNALISIEFCSQICVLKARCVTDVTLWFQPKNCARCRILPLFYLCHGWFVTCLAPYWLPPSTYQYSSPVHGSALTCTMCMEVPLMCVSAVCASEIFCRWKRPQADFHPLSLVRSRTRTQASQRKKETKDDKRANLQRKVVWRRTKTWGTRKATPTGEWGGVGGGWGKGIVAWVARAVGTAECI